MPITQEQIAERKNWIGGSDVAAILGVDPWRSARDVYASKLYDLADIESEQAQLGNALEPALMQFAQEQLGGGIQENVRCVLPHIRLATNIDGIMQRGETRTVVECKTSGLVGGVWAVSPEWGEGWSADVPGYVQAQVAAEMMAADADSGIVVALLAGRGVQYFQLDRDDAIESLIADRCSEFWECVAEQREPSGEVSIETAKRFHREPGARCDISPELIDRLEEARERRRAANDFYDSTQAEILTVLGQASAEEASDGTGRRVTYYEQTRKAYSVPEATFRVMRIGKDRR